MGSDKGVDYRILVSEIRTIFAEQDVEGLLSIHGAPRDEYDPEARDLATRIQQQGASSPEQILEWLTAIWSRSFDLGSEDMAKREHNLRMAANRIYAIGPR